MKRRTLIRKPRRRVSRRSKNVGCLGALLGLGFKLIKKSPARNPKRRSERYRRD